MLQGPSIPFSRAAPKPILGSDVAGRVVELGTGSERFRVGDEVYGDLSAFGSRGWGGFAEYVCGRESALVLKPPRMTFELRSVGFDHVIDYQTEDFTNNGRRYDLIVDAKTNRRPSDYLRALNPGGTYATVGGPLMRDLFRVAIAGLWTGRTMNKTLRLVGLKANRDLPLLNERFEAGQLVPVIDGPYPLSEGREAFRRFGAGDHLGKIVFTIE